MMTTSVESKSNNLEHDGEELRREDFHNYYNLQLDTIIFSSDFHNLIDDLRYDSPESIF